MTYDIPLDLDFSYTDIQLKKLRDYDISFEDSYFNLNSIINCPEEIIILINNINLLTKEERKLVYSTYIIKKTSIDHTYDIHSEYYVGFNYFKKKKDLLMHLTCMNEYLLSKAING